MASKLLRTGLVSLAAIGLALMVTPAAQANAPAAVGKALTGKVSSTDEGLMEGVVVSAKKDGSTITVSVVSNVAGQYSFPSDRLSPGKYTVTMRAAGYEMPPATIELTGQQASLDLKLKTV